MKYVLNSRMMCCVNYFEPDSFNLTWKRGGQEKQFYSTLLYSVLCCMNVVAHWSCISLSSLAVAAVVGDRSI